MDVYLKPIQHLAQLGSTEKLLDLHDRRLFNVFVGESAALGFEDWLYFRPCFLLSFGSADSLLNWLFDVFLHGLLDCELSHILLLLLQQFVPFSLGEKINLTCQSDFCWLHRPRQYFPLQFEV